MEQCDDYRPTPLSEAWEEAFIRLTDAASEEEYNTLIKLTTSCTADEVAAYLAEHSSDLSPEGIFFLRMSETAKRSIAES